VNTTTFVQYNTKNGSAKFQNTWREIKKKEKKRKERKKNTHFT